ncbi:MAG: helical backbone metal receptor [Bacteroidota bacterium]
MILADQMGNQIAIDTPFKRVVSLVPSQTELIVDLIGTERLVGRTKFCIHPSEAVLNVPVIGGTKKFNFDQISSLKPDLIIGNKEENYKDGIEQLQRDYPVWMSDINNLSDSYEMIRSVGKLLGVEEKATNLADRVEASLSSVKNSQHGRALYFIWQRPFIVAGKSTFIDYMLRFLGFSNTCIQMRYPEMDQYVLENLDPDYVFLSSEPFPFKQKHIDSFKKMFPRASVKLVDGEMFSWYGSRLLYAADYFSGDLFLTGKL